MLIACISTFIVGTVVSNASAYPGVEYRACSESSGWFDWVRNKETAGDITKGEKLQVIKIVREVTGLGLKEAKDVADNGGNIKENISAEEADELKAKLEEAGATVELA